MMFCKNCGTQLEDGAAFCGSCGAAQPTANAETPVVEPVVEPTVETPVAPTYENTQSAQQTETVYQATVEEPINPTTIMILGIISAGLVILCETGIFSIAGIVLGAMALNKAKKYYEVTPVELQSTKAKVGKICGLVGLIINIIAVVCVVISWVCCAACTAVGLGAESLYYLDYLDY